MIADLVNAIRRVANGKGEAWENWATRITSISNMFGIPLKNLYRDGKAMYNLISDMFD